MAIGLEALGPAEPRDLPVNWQQAPEASQAYIKAEEWPKSIKFTATSEITMRISKRQEELG